MGFLQEVDLTPVKEREGRTVWRVVNDFTYRSNKYGLDITVPKGLLTDLCSVPRVPLAWLLAGGTANAAGVVHDFLYHHRVNGRMLEQSTCDDILYEAMMDTEVPIWRAKLIWTAVHWFGSGSYKEGDGLTEETI